MPEPAWTIRPATLADAPGVAVLLTELGSPDVDTAEARRRLARAREQVFVAERGSELGGLVAATIEHYFGHELPLVQVTALVTSPAARRSGAARQLMAAAMDHAVAHRCAGIELTCGLAREDAHAFYRSLGYTATSHRYWLAA
ncbi:GNAT family N-acetyltransferase [Pseudonocardia sp. GCM10023141]|uniref:GNAT family N-acetyltransferase n=1 Tax=Pseudonocardia sp. GCM10023141 TaxID=3252653 RepID=UPI00361B135A